MNMVRSSLPEDRIETCVELVWKLLDRMPGQTQNVLDEIAVLESQIADALQGQPELQQTTSNRLRSKRIATIVALKNLFEDFRDGT